MWVAMETTTLVTAPCIYFNHNQRSLEATWKYLLIGSVGIAMALLGSFLLVFSMIEGGSEATLLFDELVGRVAHAFAALAARLVCVADGRLRHQDGSGPDAYLEAGCVRRSPGCDWRVCLLAG